MSDLIDRQTAIKTAIEAADKWDGGYSSEREGIIRKFFDKVPAVQPTCKPECKPMYADVSDTISRQWLMECVSEGWIKFDTEKDENKFMHLVRDIAPSAQPATNCSEIPNGSDDTISRQMALDAFGLSEKTRKYGGDHSGYDTRMLYEIQDTLESLPAAQPDHTADVSKKVSISCAHENDVISRKAAIEALARMMPRSYTPDGSHPADEEIFRAQEVFADCIEALEILPSAAPSTAHTTETTETTAPSTDGWVSISKRLPAVPLCRCLITRDGGRGEATVEEALFSFGKWYDNGCLEDGRNRKFDISASVIAWAPFPAPYRGGDE